LRAADLLGINRNTLRKRIRELGISVPRKPDRDAKKVGDAGERY
jgi:DNA-binding NtrC family response regulator